MLKQNALLAAQHVDMINCVLDFVHQKHLDPGFVEKLYSDLQGPDFASGSPSADDTRAGVASAS